MHTKSQAREENLKTPSVERLSRAHCYVGLDANTANPSPSNAWLSKSAVVMAQRRLDDNMKPSGRLQPGTSPTCPGTAASAQGTGPDLVAKRSLTSRLAQGGSSAVTPC